MSYDLSTLDKASETQSITTNCGALYNGGIQTTMGTVTAVKVVSPGPVPVRVLL